MQLGRCVGKAIFVQRNTAAARVGVRKLIAMIFDVLRNRIAVNRNRFEDAFIGIEMTNIDFRGFGRLR